MSDSFSVITIC